MRNRSLEFYYDYYSPYSYFAAERLEHLQQVYQLDINWQPVDIVQMLHLDKADCDNPMKRAYVNQDVVHCAEFYRLPIGMPRPFPVRSRVALIASLIIHPLGFLPTFARATFRAAWVQRQDIHDENVLAGCIQDSGGRPDAVLRRLNSEKEEYAAALRTRTTEAMRRNIFGVPMFVYGNRMLFGSDRLPMLETWVAQSDSA